MTKVRILLWTIVSLYVYHVLGSQSVGGSGDNSNHEDIGLSNSDFRYFLSRSLESVKNDLMKEMGVLQSILTDVKSEITTLKRKNTRMFSRLKNLSSCSSASEVTKPSEATTVLSMSTESMSVTGSSVNSSTEIISNDTDNSSGHLNGLLLVGSTKAHAFFVHDFKTNDWKKISFFSYGVNSVAYNSKTGDVIISNSSSFRPGGIFITSLETLLTGSPDFTKFWNGKPEALALDEERNLLFFTVATKKQLRYVQLSGGNSALVTITRGKYYTFEITLHKGRQLVFWAHKDRISRVRYFGDDQKVVRFGKNIFGIACDEREDNLYYTDGSDLWVHDLKSEVFQHITSLGDEGDVDSLVFENGIAIAGIYPGLTKQMNTNTNVTSMLVQFPSSFLRLCYVPKERI